MNITSFFLYPTTLVALLQSKKIIKAYYKIKVNQTINQKQKRHDIKMDKRSMI